MQDEGRFPLYRLTASGRDLAKAAPELSRLRRAVKTADRAGTGWRRRRTRAGRTFALPLLLLSAACGDPTGPAGLCPDEGARPTLGFYPFFEPVSYSASPDPQAPGFRRHLGYEADLLSALEIATGLSFERQPVAEWPGIWLLPATSEFDIAGGGMTILESRTVNDAGERVVAFTTGHIAFRQSLLMRSADAARISAYDELTNAVRVGVLPGTTGEARLLEITGIVDSSGTLRRGTRVDTPRGTVVADGTAAFTITAAVVSPILLGRTRLFPPSEGMPEVLYLGRETGEAELLRALADGTIDAVARGEVGNGEAARAAGGAFVVAVRDSLAEFGGFTVPVTERALLACLNDQIDWLTDERRIGYPEMARRPAGLP